MEADFWQLGHLSDQQLLAGLQGVLRTKRRALAELVAHLAEVEERRLHLQAAYGSLFAYCVQRLGMSEDEACRRIELARLSRRFPALFAELASGGLTLSVALLLKRMLTPDNHLELLAAVRGASSQRAAEILAARFPGPDAPSRIRKLPTRAGAASPAADTVSSPPASALPTAVTASVMAAAPASQPLLLEPTPVPIIAPMAAPNRQRTEQRIEPLSVGRYRVQFTADADLKRKLEQARDLLRHTQPNGDFGAIVSRALDSLLEELMRRRFGVLRKETAAKRATPPATAIAPAIVTVLPASRATTAAPSRIGRAARRAVLERDGLGCGWVDATGQRCGSIAWLEVDHRHPVGKGGSAQLDNLRLLCRAHNRLAAEHAYGRAHIERAIRARQQPAAPAPTTQVKTGVVDG